MHTVETEWWSLDLPEEWQAEQDDETIVIGDDDGVGMLEITALERRESGGAGEQDVFALAQQLFGAQPTQSATVGDFTGLYVQYVDEGDAVREWVLRNGEQIVLISYSCDVENAGLDDEIVDEILSTLRV